MPHFSIPSQPASGVGHSLPGPEDITRVQLPNGIVVLSRPNYNSPSVVIKGSLATGGLFDPDDKLGLADFAASALLRGTARRTFQQIYESLESVGASLGASGSTHTTRFGGKALVEDLDMLMTLLAEALRQPAFPQEQIERLRAQLLTSLALRAQDTSEMASLAFDQVIYASHPYRRPEDGYPETIQAIRRDDLVAFHRQHFGPRGMIIVIAGAVDPELAVEKVSQALGDWQNPDQPEPPALPQVQPLQANTWKCVPIPGKSQADLVIGAAGPSRNAEDYLAAALGNSVLGQFGLMGRIGASVRDKAGLAYYAASNLGGGPGPGPWDVSAGVDPKDVPAVIDLILEEIGRFVSEPISAEELTDNQAHFIGRLPFSFESNQGIASALLNLERYQLGLDYYRRFPDRVNAITVEDVLQAARHYLDSQRLCIAVAGEGLPGCD
ncbi:MAG: pitrilysin family protein [Chloroflexota bacterium]